MITSGFLLCASMYETIPHAHHNSTSHPSSRLLLGSHRMVQDSPSEGRGYPSMTRELPTTTVLLMVAEMIPVEEVDKEDAREERREEKMATLLSNSACSCRTADCTLPRAKSLS